MTILITLGTLLPDNSLLPGQQTCKQSICMTLLSEASWATYLGMYLENPVTVFMISSLTQFHIHTA